MSYNAENTDHARVPSPPDTPARQEPAGSDRRPQPTVAFPPGDLDALIFHDCYPVYHSER